jgi:hypothetical protein
MQATDKYLTVLTAQEFYSITNLVHSPFKKRYSLLLQHPLMYGILPYLAPHWQWLAALLG